MYSGADLSQAVVLTCVCVRVCVCVCVYLALVFMWFELSGSLAALIGMRVFLFKHCEMFRASTLVLLDLRP